MYLQEPCHLLHHKKPESTSMLISLYSRASDEWSASQFTASLAFSEIRHYQLLLTLWRSAAAAKRWTYPLSFPHWFAYSNCELPKYESWLIVPIMSLALSHLYFCRLQALQSAHQNTSWSQPCTSVELLHAQCGTRKSKDPTCISSRNQSQST